MDDLGVDCTACGRVNVSFKDSVDMCQRVYCAAFNYHRKAAVAKDDRQSKKQSIIEVCSNTFIGMIGSWIITFLVLTYVQNKAIASGMVVGLCTVWSLIRGYYVRRHFNRKT